HLHNVTGCRTVFATHYHELTQLADELVAVRNYNVAVREVGDQVLFLHLLVPGGADRSYGIEVGRLAGLPDAVLARAREILRRLEDEPVMPDAGPGVRAVRPERGVPATQLTLFATAEHPLLQRLRQVDVNGLTPVQALQVLAEVVEKARAERS